MVDDQNSSSRSSDRSEKGEYHCETLVNIKMEYLDSPLFVRFRKYWKSSLLIRTTTSRSMSLTENQDEFWVQISNMNKMHNEVYGAMVQCEVVSKEHLPDYKTDYGN